MTKCKRREVKVQASGSIQNIICNVTVFSNASVPQSSLQAIKDWRTTSGESILYVTPYIYVVEPVGLVMKFIALAFTNVIH